jgi:hypothetical protein
MKAKNVNRRSGYYDIEIEVRMMDYNYVYGLLPGGYSKVKLPFENMEFTFKEEWEKDAVKYRDLLSIPLPRTSSLKLYAAISSALEGSFGKELQKVVIMRDYCEKVRKNIWYKTTELVINGINPVIMKIVGHDYSDLYDIKIQEIDKDNFISNCEDNVSKLKELLDKNRKKIELYEQVMTNLHSNGKESVANYNGMIKIM